MPLQKYFQASSAKKESRSSSKGAMIRVDRTVHQEPPILVSSYNITGLKILIGSFEISRFAITKKEWRNVFWWAAENDYKISRGTAETDKHPITGVSKYDCLAWCNAKSEMENLSPCYFSDGELFKGASSIRCRWAEEIVQLKINSNGYRLPTMIEWCWAAAGGSKSKGFKYSGSNSLDSVAWCDTGLNGPRPVGQKSPNEIGIYDMSGNVWEWVWNGGNGPRKGGSWASYETECEVDRYFEYQMPAYLGSAEIGLRFVRSLDRFPQNGMVISDLSTSDVDEIVRSIEFYHSLGSSGVRSIKSSNEDARPG